MADKIAVYIRFGSHSAGFVLPDEREAFKAYMNRAKQTDTISDKIDKRVSGCHDGLNRSRSFIKN